MRMAIYIVLALVGLVLLLAGMLGIIGSFIPVSHTATMTVTVAMPRDQVWALIDDVAGFPKWLPNIDKVEILPDHDGHRVFKQSQGRNAFVLEETVKTPPSVVTRTITDVNAMFTGSWEHRFEEAGPGRTRITVNETGTVPSPIPRAITRLAVGYDYYLNKFGEALKAKCGT